MVQLSTPWGDPEPGNVPPVRRFLSNYFDLLLLLMTAHCIDVQSVSLWCRALLGRDRRLLYVERLLDIMPTGFDLLQWLHFRDNTALSEVWWLSCVMRSAHRPTVTPSSYSLSITFHPLCLYVEFCQPRSLMLYTSDSHINHRRQNASLSLLTVIRVL